MKRLLDESTDELTRSLLQAGVEHRPPPGNKRQLIVAMGAGGALGLFSSNAFAWLGTTAGKVTAAGVAVGVAGAVFVAGPLLRPSEPSSHAPEQAISAARPSAERDPEVPRTRAQPSSPALAEHAVNDPVLADASQDEPELSRRAVLPTESDEASEPGAPRAVTEPRKAAVPSQKKAQGKRASARKSRAGASLQKKSASRKRGDAVVSTAAVTDTPAPATAGTEVAADARRAALDAEVRLVDDMHAAARRKERAALARLVAAYRAEFPDGQLKKEVADFEQSLERLDRAGAESP
jgi:hypothetical protein